MIATMAGIAVAMLIKNPHECFLGCLVALLGLPAYVLFVRIGKRPRIDEGL